MTELEKKQLADILEQLCISLDITENEYNAAVKSYLAVGEQLTKRNSELMPYNPEILPQGSFMLGTMVRPINDEDDLDIDIVCQLTNKKTDWTQFDLKQKVGDQLKANATYARMIKNPEGRRCWTLVYSNDSNYHMDILPSIVDSGYRIILEKAFENTELINTNELAIRITDRKEPGYTWETNHHLWLKSNPFGYARWFFHQATLDFGKAFSISAAIQPVSVYNKDKLPLQRVIQILKRHRDIIFNGDEDKPISIIITTLAAKAYTKQSSTIDALMDIVENMSKYIEERYSDKYKRNIKWIPNPVNEEENFADKWPETPKKEDAFYQWLIKLKTDLDVIFDNIGLGLHEVQKAFSISFGENIANETFIKYGKLAKINRDKGALRMAAGIGMLGTEGTPVKKHNFEGNIE